MPRLRNTTSASDCSPLSATRKASIDHAIDRALPYTTWLGLHSTVSAATLQQYYSDINKFFRDHQQEPIAVGKLLADTRRGLDMLQQRFPPSDARLPIIALVALALLQYASAMRATTYWTSTNIVNTSPSSELPSRCAPTTLSHAKRSRAYAAKPTT
jgi:hypothetical protein